MAVLWAYYGVVDEKVNRWRELRVQVFRRRRRRGGQQFKSLLGPDQVVADTASEVMLLLQKTRGDVGFGRSYTGIHPAELNPLRVKMRRWQRHDILLMQSQRIGDVQLNLM